MEWKNLLGTIAPWLGTALGGPLGGLAVEAASDALGLSDKTEASLKQALSGATQEDLLKLKQAEQEFAIKMQELGFAQIKDMEALAVNDRDSARKREMTVLDHTPRNLAYALITGYFAIIAVMLFAELPTTGRDLLNILIGMLGTSVSSVISYYFGSTAGSRAKSELLAKSTLQEDK